MKDDLLVSLRKYRPREGHDPIENFVTESFAWMLSNNSEISECFILRITERLNVALKGKGVPLIGQPLWDTQMTLRNGSRPDMVCMDGSGDVVLAFEHKVWSQLHDNQLGNYRHGLALSYPNKQHFVILITGNAADFSQGPDIALCWRDVYGWIKDWIKGSPIADSGLAPSFLRLLEHEGLGPADPISFGSIRSYMTGRHLTDSVNKLLRSVCHESRSHFGIVDTANSDDVRWWGQWGSYGIQVVGNKKPQTWTPGLFVGFLLDPEDHLAVPTLGRNSSPDFCLRFSFFNSFHSQYLRMAAFERLCNDLDTISLRLHSESAGSGWNVYRHYEETVHNRFHPLYLRQPMLEFFRDTMTFEDQKNRFIKTAGGLYQDVIGLQSFQDLQHECSALSSSPTNGAPPQPNEM